MYKISSFFEEEGEDEPRRIRSAVKVVERGAPKEKATSSKKPRKSSSKTNTCKSVGSTHPTQHKENNVLDITKLSESDVSNLRQILGIQNPVNCERMTVSIDADDISDFSEGEIPPESCTTKTLDMANALFDDGLSGSCDDEWSLPKLKTPDKGKPIAPSLAKMINVACTSQCETETLISKYPIPENCDKMCAPIVNNEIWKIMSKNSQTQDRYLAQTQNVVAAGMTPIIKLAEVLKQQIMSNNEAKTLLSDALTLLGQVQFNLSVKRRYLIRPVLKKKYHPLCNVSMPITSNLFGDEVAKEIKSCDSTSSLGKSDFYQSGRGRGRFPRRGSYRGARGGGSEGSYNQGSYNQRYHPYAQRGKQEGRQGYRIPKKATATVTSPNEN